MRPSSSILASSATSCEAHGSLVAFESKMDASRRLIESDLRDVKRYKGLVEEPRSWGHAVALGTTFWDLDIFSIKCHLESGIIRFIMD